MSQPALVCSDVHDMMAEASLGLLDAPAQRAFDAHLDDCPACRREALASLDALDALAPLPALAPPPSLLGDVLADIDARPPFSGFVRRFSSLFDVPPDAARAILAGAADEGAWQPYIDRVSLQHFAAGPAVAGADTGLVRFGKGLVYPMHRHEGDEYVFVLSGGFVEAGTGDVARPGDIKHRGPGTSHTFTIDDDRDCVCAVVLFGGLPVFI